ncbi:MAG TPA: glycosyltransferase family 4 protein [Thermoanaerobaculia bacterium]|nr:glycosyltransferase family 4 protein [Thermoanaerobaculia bacterium]
MKITFVTEHYPPDAGGVATSSKRIAEALVRVGHQIQVLTFDNRRPLRSDDYFEESAENGVAILRFGPFFLRHPDLATTPLSEKLRAVFRRRVCKQMAREARAFAPDVVMAFYLLNAGFLARFVAAELNVPSVMGVRGNDIGLNIFHVERFAAIRWTLEGASHIICVNQHLRRRVLMILPNLAPLASVVFNSVSMTASSEEKVQARVKILSATGWAEETLILVFIGTLREKKGVVPLLSALDQLPAQKAIKLLVIGPSIGSVEQRLCGETWDRLCDAGVIYCTGQLPRDQVAPWAAGGDIAVMPCLDDGLANGLLEGMSLGLCPIASLIFEDVIDHGVTGLLFDQSRPDELASLMLRLNDDREFVARLGAAARTYVRERHRPDREAQGYSELLESMALAHRGGK